jgi:hypothetical protein
MAIVGLWLRSRSEQRFDLWHARAARAAGGNETLQNLERKLRDRLLLPGEPGYDIASVAKMTRYADIRPIVVALGKDETNLPTCAVDRAILTDDSCKNFPNTTITEGKRQYDGGEVRPAGRRQDQIRPDTCSAMPRASHRAACEQRPDVRATAGPRQTLRRSTGFALTF